MAPQHPIEQSLACTAFYSFILDYVMLCQVRNVFIRLEQIRLGQIMSEIKYCLLDQIRLGQVRNRYFHSRLSQVRLDQVKLEIRYFLLDQLRLGQVRNRYLYSRLDQARLEIWYFFIRLAQVRLDQVRLEIKFRGIFPQHISLAYFRMLGESSRSRPKYKPRWT